MLRLGSWKVSEMLLSSERGFLGLLTFGADSFAALWQSRYAGLVPKGSLFSLLQRLGMKGFV